MRVLSMLLIVLISGGLAVAPAAQPAAKVAAPGAANDADFASFVKSATTRPDFSSPVIDHLPTRSGVPTPKDVLGYHIGAERKLTYWADQQKWYRALEKALPGRVKTTVIGRTEEGREIMLVYVTSESNLKNLEANRANMRRLADPRGLGIDEAKKIIAGTRPHYHLSAGLHSGETSTSEMLMELAYRLAVSDEPYVQQIRDNVIVSMTPTTDIDGRDRYVIGTTPTRLTKPTMRARTTANRPTGASTSSMTTTATSITAWIRCEPISSGIWSGYRRSGTTSTRRRRCSTPTAVARRRMPTGIRSCTAT
jgi:hypothetical protein